MEKEVYRMKKALVSLVIFFFGFALTSLTPEESFTVKSQQQLISFLNGHEPADVYIIMPGEYQIKASELTGQGLDFSGRLDAAGAQINIECDVPCRALFHKVRGGQVRNLSLRLSGDVSGYPFASAIEEATVENVSIRIEGDVLPLHGDGASVACGFAGGIAQSSVKHVRLSARNIATPEDNAYIATGFYGDLSGDATGQENHMSDIWVTISGGVYGEDTATGFGRAIAGWFDDIQITVGGDLNAQREGSVRYASGFAGSLKGSDSLSFSLNRCTVRVGGSIRALVTGGVSNANHYYGGFLTEIGNTDTAVTNCRLDIGGDFDIKAASHRTVYAGGFIGEGLGASRPLVQNSHAVIGGDMFLRNQGNVQISGFFNDMARGGRIENAGVLIHGNMGAESATGYTHVVGFATFAMQTVFFDNSVVEVRGDIISNSPMAFAYISGFADTLLSGRMEVRDSQVYAQSMTASGLHAAVNGFGFDVNGTIEDAHVEIKETLTALGQSAASVSGFAERVTGQAQYVSVKARGMTASASAGDARSSGFSGRIAARAAVDHASVLVGGNIAAISAPSGRAVACGFVQQLENEGTVAYCFTKVIGDVTHSGDAENADASGFAFEIGGSVDHSSCYVKGETTGGGQFVSRAMDTARISECTLMGDKKSFRFARYKSRAMVSENNFFTLVDGRRREVISLTMTELGHVKIGSQLSRYIESNHLAGQNDFVLYGSESVNHKFVDNAVVVKGPRLSEHLMFALAATINGKAATLDIFELSDAPVDHHSLYITGYPDNTFRPHEPLLRSEAAVVFHRLSKQDGRAGKAKATVFRDVDTAAWYSDSVYALTALGVFRGANGLFLPHRPITRAEFAQIVSVLYRLPAQKQEKFEYSDVPSSYWAYESILAASAAGWMEGYNDGTFRPEQWVTRLEAVRMINHAHNRKWSPTGIAQAVHHFSDVDTDNRLFADVTEAAHNHSYTRTAQGDEEWVDFSRE